MQEGAARRRLDSLDEALARVSVGDTHAPPFPLSVSHGLACFDSLAQLQHAIEEADGAMYARKQARKAVAQTSQVETINA